jgi:Sporulation and spore germination
VIPRYQVIIFSILVLASLAMAGGLWHLRQRAHQRLVAGVDSAPTKAPEVAPAEKATLMVANDSDNSLLAQVHSLPLPADPGSRARAVLGRLLDIYAAKDSNHPIPGGATSVAQVFLLPLHGTVRRADASKTTTVVATDTGAPISGGPAPSNPQMAVVNLTGTFVAGHPAGLEAETLTVLSMCGTIHANLPDVTEVRFLVDGQVRPTLAGHADLTRTYLVGDTAVSSPGAAPLVPTEVSNP